MNLADRGGGFLKLVWCNQTSLSGEITKGSDAHLTAAAHDRKVDLLRRLVHDVAALVLAIDPELVVIGGWAAGLDGVLEPLRAELARYCLRPPRVSLSALGREAIATGALRLALDHVEEQLFAVERTSPHHR